MAIITTAKVKTLLQISGSTYDSLIDELIPAFQNWIVEYLQNWFHTGIYLDASTIAFVHSEPDTITDSDEGFVDADFTDSIDIHVSGSKDNDGIYAVDTAAAGTLKLESGEELIAEDAGEGVTITRVKFPKALWMPTALCIKVDMAKRDPSLKSKSLADHSESYSEDGRYPPALLKMFNPWKQFNYP